VKATLCRTAGAGLAVTALVIAAAGCSGSSSGGSGTIQLWHFFSDREAGVIKSVVADFSKSSGIKVSIHSGQDDEKVQHAIAAGKQVDVAISYSTDIIGKFCTSGAFRDLGPYIKKDGVDLSAFPQQVRSYTEYKGKRCSMPVLADTYGLYYNKTLFQAAGIAAPPKTLDEFDADVRKTTQRNQDGSIKVAGFVPLSTYFESTPQHFGPLWGAKWFDSSGRSNLAADPGWKAMAQWQNDLVKFYGDGDLKTGYDRLKKFTAGLGQEFDAGNPFHKGQIAMMIDGEFRTAFIADQAKDLQYGTAPFPVPADHADRYGAGFVTGNIAGIGKGSKNPDKAWKLLKYLTTDTGALVKLSQGLKNVPTTQAALGRSGLAADPNFKTFIDIYNNPNTMSSPSSPNGGLYQVTFQNWLDGYQAGKETDLDGGLKKTDKAINDAIKLGGG
jgi:multiple sugar transport system substrate-binding protein